MYLLPSTTANDVIKSPFLVAVVLAGGAAFISPLLTDYNLTSPRVLARAPPSNRYWYAYFAQPTRGSYEPPPGATGEAAVMGGGGCLPATVVIPMVHA